MRISRMKMTTGAVVAALLIPVTASARPVSSTTVDVDYAGGNLTLTHDGVAVSSLSAERACDSTTNTESWTASNVATSSVDEGRASNPTWIDVTADITHAGCDGTTEILIDAPLSVMLVDTGRVQRHRTADRARVLTTPVGGTVYLPTATIPSVSGTSTEVISR